jgi:hypothetical protein
MEETTYNQKKICFHKDILDSTRINFQQSQLSREFKLTILCRNLKSRNKKIRSLLDHRYELTLHTHFLIQQGYVQIELMPIHP